MRSSTRVKLGAFCCAFCCWSWLATVPSQAQDDQYVPPEGESQTPSSGTTNLENIDELLEQDEDVLASPSTYNYDPGARRDPFRSLIQQRQQAPEAEVQRPPGIPGLLIDEVQVQGVFVLPDGPVVQVQSASQETSFLLRAGDQLWDGDVVSITLEGVVFKQKISDPTARKPFREVVKKLNP